MAPHSSTLAWKIPWMEEPGRLQSMGSLGVGHDWVTSLSLFSFMHWRRKWQPTPVFLPGESQGQGSLVGCHLWGRRVGHDWSNLAAAAWWTKTAIIHAIMELICSRRDSNYRCVCVSEIPWVGKSRVLGSTGQLQPTTQVTQWRALGFQRKKHLEPEKCLEIG